MYDFSLLNWNDISSDYMEANTKFDIFYDPISQFILSFKLLNLFLPKFDMPVEISSIPKSLLSVNDSNPNLIYFHKKFRNCVVKYFKSSRSDYFII